MSSADFDHVTAEGLRKLGIAMPRWLNWLGYVMQQPRMQVANEPWVYFWRHRL